MLVHPRVVARLGAVVADALEARTRVLVERPALRAMIAGGLRPVERRLALAAIEAAHVAAAERHPHDAVACRCRRRARRSRASARCRSRPAPCSGGLEPGASRTTAPGTPSDRAPHRSVHRARHHGVEPGVDALVLGRIDRLFGFDVRVALAVAVGVQHQRRPALRLRRVAGLVEHLGVEPADHRAAAARPQRLVGVVAELRMVRREAGVDERVLLASSDRASRGGGRRAPSGTPCADGWSDPCLQNAGFSVAAHRRRQPQPAVAAEHRVVVVGPRVPDALAAPVGRRLQRVERGGVPGPEAERHARIAHRRRERRRDVLHRDRGSASCPSCTPATRTAARRRSPSG